MYPGSKCHHFGEIEGSECYTHFTVSIVGIMPQVHISCSLNKCVWSARIVVGPLHIVISHDDVM